LKGWRHRTLQLADQFARYISDIKKRDDVTISREQICGYLLACAYPDRIARQRQSGGFQLANGRGAAFQSKHQFRKHRWIAAGEITGTTRSQGDTIRTAAALDATLFDSLLSELRITEDSVEWDMKAGRFIAERVTRIGSLKLSSISKADIDPETKLQTIIQHIRTSGIDLLPWDAVLRNWQARLMLVREHEGDNWPNVSDSHLLSTLEDWLAPWLTHITKATDFRKLDLKSALSSMLTWEQQKALDKLAPERIEVPSGSHIRIDYSQSPPVLAVKLQEMFGCEESPKIINGKVTLLVHLLSPAGRPLQVTSDLAGFWRSSYFDVKKDMKGRYPKHPWPDDPLGAEATRFTKGKI
ncbi:MAG: ATP-dependent helicase HrpB, partial [Pseudomonadales bacterium]|nr:ATP-dependent helicase HrpB [Pseudomonadales bacterium]